MEDNKAPEAPSPCTAGCGFYGNKIYNNMCSKCFKELEKNNSEQHHLWFIWFALTNFYTYRSRNTTRE